MENLLYILYIFRAVLTYISSIEFMHFFIPVHILEQCIGKVYHHSY